jgi:hypothetical protein
MRTRQTIAAVAAVSAVAASGIAAISIANAGEDDPQTETSWAANETQASIGTVILPTGDRVTVSPDGTTGLQRAEGREHVHFLAFTAPDGSGDTIVVPSDQVETIRSGAEDPRRYNISQLLSDGHTDAAAVPESELDTREYDGLAPAAQRVEAKADTQPVTVTIADSAGEVPDGNFVGWFNTTTGEEDFFSFDANGVGTEDLPAGDYLIFGEVWNETGDAEATEIVMGATDVTVTDAPVETTFKGTDASLISAEVEQPDAVYSGALVAVGFTGAAEADGAGSGIMDFPGPKTETYVLAEPETPESTELDFSYHPSFSSPEGAESPYRYNLSFDELGGIPDDLAFSVTDAELAVEETTYNSFGTDLSGNACDVGSLSGSVNGGWCALLPVQVPSVITDYRTADPEIEWSGVAEYGTFDEEGFMLLDGFTDTYSGQVLQPGETTVAKGHGPFGAGAPDMIVTGDADGADTTTYLAPATSYNGETVNLVGYEGTATLSLNGVELGRFDGSDTYPVVDAALTEAGRYTLASETTRGTDTVALGTANTQSWSFDLDPTALADAEELYPALPVVALSTEGVDGGYADAAAALDVTLSLVSGPSAEPTTAEAMTFEVSYDDGETWTDVPLDLGGGTATATLEHPEGAEYVSTRMTATDDAGTEVSHTTIRSFGLK